MAVVEHLFDHGPEQLLLFGLPGNALFERNGGLRPIYHYRTWVQHTGQAGVAKVPMPSSSRHSSPRSA